MSRSSKHSPRDLAVRDALESVPVSERDALARAYLLIEEHLPLSEAFDVERLDRQEDALARRVSAREGTSARNGRAARRSSWGARLSGQRTRALAGLGLAAGFVMLVAILGLRPTAVEAVDAVRVVTLADGSRLTLNRGAQIAYRPLFDVFHRTLRLSGEVHFDVVPSRYPFRVQTTNAITTVSGTRFEVEAAGDGPTRVTLEEGRVVVKAVAADASVVLVPGQQTIVERADTAPLPPRRVDLAAEMGWRFKQLRFVERSAREIVTAVEHAYGVAIDADGAVRLDRELTYIAPRPIGVEAVLDDLSYMLGARYTHTPTGFILVPAEEAR